MNAVVSNELLARKAATEDLPTGLQAWLQLLGLGQYAGALASWCQSMGAASPEENRAPLGLQVAQELAEFAPEAAAAVEADTKAQEHIAEVLRKAVERPIHTVMRLSLSCFGLQMLEASEPPTAHWHSARDGARAVRTEGMILRRGLAS